MEGVQAIIIRVVIFLAIAQLSHTAPQNARNIAASKELEKRVSSPPMNEGEKSDAYFHSVEKRHSQVFDVPPMFLQNCNKIYNLDIGDSAVFFSEDGIDRKRCRFRFKSPKGTRINIECPVFNLNKEGCRMESFTLNERGRKKETFCKRNKPPVEHGKSNRITVAYRRNKVMKNKKNRGYICRAFVIMEDPTTTASTTTHSSLAPSTYFSWVTPSNTASSTTTPTPTTIIPTFAPTFLTFFPIPTTTSTVENDTTQATTILPLFPLTFLPVKHSK